MQNPDKTFELMIAPRGARKDDVIAWLEARGITGYVEGVIDGVDLEVETEDAATAFEQAGAARAPLLIFDYDEQHLRVLEQALAKAFAGQIELKVNVLATSSWSAAWDQASASFETAGFVVSQDEGLAVPANKQHLLLTGGAAFGQGDHATTMACLYALEVLPETVPRRLFLDVGTGTGILAIAAAKLGFTEIVATDIVDEALDEARINANLNGVEIELHEASVPPEDGRRYDVVAANILVPVLHQLMPRLAAALAPGGRMLLAGFIEKEREALLATCAQSGLCPQAKADVRGWLCLTLAHAASESTKLQGK